MAKPKAPPFQPLRIPTGWEVAYNAFYEVEARFRSWDATSWHFQEDMLQLRNRHRAVLIDLGWVPSHRSIGQFVLRAVRLLGRGQGGDWDEPLRQLRTRSRRKAVATLEDWLHWYSEHGVSPGRSSRR